MCLVSVKLNQPYSKAHCKNYKQKATAKFKIPSCENWSPKKKPDISDLANYRILTNMFLEVNSRNYRTTL